ncbi:MAG: hypothetical protein ACJ8F2_01970 [Xanthobacteraceae bacterium]
MNKALSACLLSVALSFPLAANAQSPLVRFDGGIGVVPVRAGPLPNTVRGVNPGGVPWVISRLIVDVKIDGRVSVDGRGLLLGGTDNIGTPGGQSVKARLFCGASLASSDSAVVPLEANGDFRIDGVLAPVPPTPCTTPVLLIVSGANGNWFAAGIPKL